MTQSPDFDVQAAHSYFSAECFNRTWDLIDIADRSSKQDDEMVQLCLASAWHWSQRQDCTAKNLSISYWQAARVFALLGQADNARRYGRLCLEISRSEGVPPFYLAYAYEAMARAEAVAGNRGGVDEYLAAARRVAEEISKLEDRQQLLDDLKTVQVAS
jgi:hypothetical protein